MTANDTDNSYVSKIKNLESNGITTTVATTTDIGQNISRSNGHQNGNDTLSLSYTIDINDIFDGALHVIQHIKPLWAIDDIKFKVFTDGATNKLIGCYHIPPSSTTEPQNPSGNGINVVCLESVPDEEVVLVRIYGHNTELLIDRKQEICDFKLLHSYGFASRLLAIFKNGLAYEYAHGSVTTKESIYDDRVWHKVAKRMAEMHRIVQRKGNPDKQPVLWKKLDNFFKLIPNRYTDPKKQEIRDQLIPSLDQLKSERDQLYAILSTTNIPVVFAHNDLLLGNIIFDSTKNTVMFIDYEYAGYNYQAFDIGNHFAEFAGMQDIDYSLYPSREYQLDWLRVYLTNYHKNDDVAINDEYLNEMYVQVNQFALAAHLFWTIWALIQAEHSEIDYDFLDFASKRINEYLAKKEQFLSL